MTFAQLVDKILGLIHHVIPFLFGIAFIVLAWRIIKAWVVGGGDKTAVAEGKKILLTGVVVFVVLICVWGIVAMVRGFFLG